MAEKHESQHPSKSSQQAMHENDAHTREIHSQDAVPGDDTAHAHSHAAHLDNTFASHTPPQGNIPADTRQDLNEPPQEVSRTGKGRRRE